ncbi:MAG: hypothetical protein U0946_04530 [Patescibacteria group bacterium]|nr:hypothetical protein [Patescibacteria group bacterium]
MNKTKKGLILTIISFILVAAGLYFSVNFTDKHNNISVTASNALVNKTLD